MQSGQCYQNLSSLKVRTSLKVSTGTLGCLSKWVPETRGIEADVRIKSLGSPKSRVSGAQGDG